MTHYLNESINNSPAHFISLRVPGWGSRWPSYSQRILRGLPSLEQRQSRRDELSDFQTLNRLQEVTWMFETKRGSQCLGGIKMLGRDLSGWGWNRRGCGQVWAGRVPGGDSPGGCFGGTFGAFVTFGWFLRWSFLFVHSSYFQQREHIVWCRCVARFLSLFPSIKGIGSFWMSTLKPYKRVSVFRLLSSNFCFCAELWSDRHRLLSFQEADFFFFFFFWSPRGEVRLESGSLTRFFVKGSNSHFSHFHQGRWMETASHFKSWHVNS